MVRVSICMATYNGAGYLREQMDSIMVQLQPEDELIISDDHSTDETMSILASYRDPRVRVITNPGGRGHVQNFAHAMASATAEFIALSDQDDIWVADRLERMIQRLKRMPEHSLVVGDFLEFDCNGTLANQTSLGPSPANGTDALFRIFIGRAKYFGSTFLFRRDLLRYVLPIPPLIEAHDIWIAMNATIRGRVEHLQEMTLMRRLHEGNLSPRHRRGLLKVLRSRGMYLVSLLLASFR